MYEIFENLLKEKGITPYQLGKETGISTATLSNWKNGKYKPKDEKLQILADYFGVTLEYLKGSTKFNTKEEELANIIKEAKYCGGLKKVKSVQIPVLGKVVAGIPLEAIEEILDYEEIPEEMTLLGQYFALKVQGDSMQPRICEDDVLIVRKQSTAESGEIVIALVNGHDATCKKLIRHQEGISLVSFNSVFEPMYFSNKDIIELPVQIIGKVIENRQKY